MSFCIIFTNNVILLEVFFEQFEAFAISMWPLSGHFVFVEKPAISQRTSFWINHLDE